MKPSSEELLISIRDTLAQRVRPLLPPQQSLDLLHAASLALEELISREAAGREHYRGACARSEVLARRAAELARKTGTHVRQVPAASTFAIDVSHEELSAALDATRTYLVELIPTLGALAQDQTAAGELRDAARQLFTDILREEAQQACPLPPSHLQPSVKSDDNEDLRFKLTDYLRQKLEGAADLHIAAISRPSHGFSRYTLIVTLTGVPASKRELVLRVEKPMGNLRGVGRSVEQEYAVMRVLAPSSLPLPKPLWLEQDASLLDGRFIVMERAAGETFGSYFDADRPIGRGLFKQFAELLATLHAFEWEAHRYELSTIGAREIRTVEDAVSQQLDRWCAYWREARLAPVPAITLLHDWLRRNVPKGVRPVLDHGDLGFHNMLCQGEEITALLDWELVSLGSPAKSLAEVREVVSSHVPWSEFMQWYVAAGGEQPSEAQLHYFRVMRFFIGFIGTGNALERAFLSSVSDNIEYLELGIGARGYYHRTAAAQTDLLWPERR